MKIRWVIQNNLISDNDLQKVKQACSDIDVEFQEVEVIPFSDQLPDILLDDKINIYYGSTSLMYNIYHQLDRPIGLFFNEPLFSMKKYMDMWGNHMLNADAQTTTLREFSGQDHDLESVWFIRPDADDKSFNGQVMSFQQILDWHKNITTYDNVIFDADSSIIVGPPYNVEKEWRTFVVDGKVISSSQYRENFNLKKVPGCPDDVIEFVEARCQEFVPHKIFVMDVALCGGEYFIIECGCMNSVGFYLADIGKIVRAVSEFVVN